MRGSQHRGIAGVDLCDSRWSPAAEVGRKIIRRGLMAPAIWHQLWTNLGPPSKLGLITYTCFYHLRPPRPLTSRELTCAAKLPASFLPPSGHSCCHPPSGHPPSGRLGHKAKMNILHRHSSRWNRQSVAVHLHRLDLHGAIAGGEWEPHQVSGSWSPWSPQARCQCLCDRKKAGSQNNSRPTQWELASLVPGIEDQGHLQVWGVRAQSCPTFLQPHELYPGFFVQGIFQAIILEWVTMPPSRGSSRPRDRTLVFCISCIGRWVLYH